MPTTKEVGRTLSKGCRNLHTPLTKTARKQRLCWLRLENVHFMIRERAPHAPRPRTNRENRHSAAYLICARENLEHPFVERVADNEAAEP